MTKEQQIHKLVLKSHAEKRFLQRYHIRLNKRMYQYIIKCIKLGNTKMSYEQADGRSVHVLTLFDKTVPIIYDAQLQEIVTCLPSMLYLDWSKIKN